MRVVKVELTRSVSGTTRLIKEEEALVEVMEVAAAGVVVGGLVGGWGEAAAASEILESQCPSICSIRSLY